MTADARVLALGDITTMHLFDIVIDLDPGWVSAAAHSAGGFCSAARAAPGRPADAAHARRRPDPDDLRRPLGDPPELRADLSDPVRRYQVDPAGYYFRTNPLFETGAEQYAWLNDIVCAGSVYLVTGGIAYKVSQVV